MYLRQAQVDAEASDECSSIGRGEGQLQASSQLGSFQHQTTGAGNTCSNSMQTAASKQLVVSVDMTEACAWQRILIALLPWRRAPDVC